MWGSLLKLFIGFDRIKQKGDRFFLEGDFHRARHHYVRARAVLPELDYRVPTLEALIRECNVRTGTPQPETTLAKTSRAELPVTDPAVMNQAAAERMRGEDEPFVPGEKDLLDLAVAGKPAGRAALYRDLGNEFESGYVALVQGDAKSAVERLGAARRTAAGSFVIRLELGRALAMADDLDASRVELEEAVRLEPSDIEARTLLAAVYLKQKRPSEVERLLLTLADKEGVGPEPSFLLGQALARQGRRREALQRFRAAVEREGTFHDAFFEAGRILREEKDDEGALRLFVQACSLVPDDVEYNRELATLVLSRELDVETGLAACDRLMVTDEENRWEYLSWIAELYLRRGWKREAIDPLKKAVELAPRDRTDDVLRLRKRLIELEMG